MDKSHRSIEHELSIIEQVVAEVLPREHEVIAQYGHLDNGFAPPRGYSLFIHTRDEKRGHGYAFGVDFPDPNKIKVAVREVLNVIGDK